MDDTVEKDIHDADPGKDKGSNELGVTGLEEFSGTVDEEKLPQLRGNKGAKQFREMGDNDSTAGAVLFAIESLLRKVEWPVIPASEDPDDVARAEFITECRDDMSHSWESFISETMSMNTFGWASHEIVYKQRLGPDQEDASKRSRFTDGKIGWRKLPIRAQETLNRWEFDEDGGVKGWWQDPPNAGGDIFLPIEKLLNFRTTSKKNNPEGRSLLRTAWISYYRKKNIERIESIGIERDLAGIPRLFLPPNYMDPNADSATKATYKSYQKLVRNIRNDEQAGIILPSVFDDKGNRLVELDLMGTGSRRLFDTNAIITRYSKAIATTMLADVILMGQEKVGSFSLASSKTALFATAIGTLLDEIQSVLNRFAIPRLERLNGESLENPPKFKHGDVEKEDIAEFATAVSTIIAAGGITPGGEEDEKHFRRMFGMPDIQVTEDQLFDPREPETESEEGTPTEEEFDNSQHDLLDIDPESKNGTKQQLAKLFVVLRKMWKPFRKRR